jgi:translation initiation factor IF-1
MGKKEYELKDYFTKQPYPVKCDYCNGTGVVDKEVDRMAKYIRINTGDFLTIDLFPMTGYKIVSTSIQNGRMIIEAENSKEVEEHAKRVLMYAKEKSNET